MTAPIVSQGSSLIVPIQSTLADEEWVTLQSSLDEQVRALRSRGVVIDVGSLDVLDSFAGRMLQSIAQSLKLAGVQAIVVGISPEIAYSMVQLGLSLGGIATALDLDRALEMLRCPDGAHG
jgi:rsbT antagonist protein RsbS